LDTKGLLTPAIMRAQTTLPPELNDLIAAKLAVEELYADQSHRYRSRGGPYLSL
jgi:hypothetical protein